MIEAIKSSLSAIVEDAVRRYLDGYRIQWDERFARIDRSLAKLEAELKSLQFDETAIPDMARRLASLEERGDKSNFDVRQYVEARMAEGDIELNDAQVRRCISNRQIKEAAEEVMQDIDFSDAIQSALEIMVGNGQLDDCFENSGFIKALYENEEFMQRLACAMLDAVAEKRIGK